jgi:hypothetical protein
LYGKGRFREAVVTSLARRRLALRHQNEPWAASDARAALVFAAQAAGFTGEPAIARRLLQRVLAEPSLPRGELIAVFVAMVTVELATGEARERGGYLRAARASYLRGQRLISRLLKLTGERSEYAEKHAAAAIAAKAVAEKLTTMARTPAP